MTHSHETPQWQAVEGTQAALHDTITYLREHLHDLEALTADLYAKAPDAHIRLTLEASKAIRDKLAWLDRIAIDEANARDLLTRRATADASGYGPATIQRWSKRPIYTEQGHYGPGTYTNK